ncbi:uncharacterized protein LOC103308768 [Acyrthosiphon pisum]|uniref:Integrase catalytic domain-containing protein n=1 Tax=Acyrthosiphon pisum TaxID=7029 RepID=A0A8R2F6P4_ACYPI|nr:uncharacterized protein LOC103308768 [Acyrthosiphon pisum]|eukprot:XP_008181004.1 PREDICTED: uncharacterized protein LOC103308768 [Acyrthosiphon pisum]
MHVSPVRPLFFRSLICESNITGPSNVIDTLSRNPVDQDLINNQSNSLGIFIVTPRRLLTKYQSRIESFQHILREQQMNPALRKVVGLLSNQSLVLSAIAERYCPKKCIAAIQEVCYFRGLSGNDRRVVKSCDTCQRAKFSTVRTEGEMQHVLANAHLQFVRLFTIKRSSAVVVTNRMISDYIEVHGAPQTIVSDHGVQFVSNVWRARLTALGVGVTTTSVYHHQSNPAERVMR